MTEASNHSPESARRVRWQWITLATMYLGYMAFMICRNTLIATSPALIDDPALGLDKAKYGELMSWHSAGAIGGKLVTGLAADLMGGRKLFLLALLLTALSNVAFAMASSLVWFKVFNFSGQFFKSAGWPAMAKLIGNWYAPNQHGRMWSLISTSSRVGTMTAMIVLGGLLAVMHWRMAFYLSTAITLLVVVAAYFLLKDHPEDLGLEPPMELDDGPHEVVHELDGTTLAQACWAFLTSPRVWLICIAICFLTILVDFITFVPIYLSETLNLEDNQASMSSSSFLVGMFVALLTASVFYDRFTKWQLVGVLGSLLGLGCGCVLLLWSLPALGLSESMRVPAALATLFTFGFAISISYYIPMSVFSISFGGPHSGFLITLIDVFGYIAALLFNLYGGSIAEHHGWPVFLSTLLTIALLATGSMTTFLVLDARHARKMSQHS